MTDSATGETPTPHPRILIADDFQDVRMLLRLQLQRTGRFEVVGEAANGEEAVSRATELQPDVVLLDMSMPRMDGLEALPLIRDAVPNVRVLVLSGFDEGSMAQKALELGADGYIEKGLRMNLAEKIDSVLG
ncbi:MAG: response regulator transcription factor [Jatrophihabitans sp.]|uniref:response regulator transcription factor n=1 Tax=Jatrophihabitans sp. TaxID=1932789 RepID=UPI003F7F5C5D